MQNDCEKGEGIDLARKYDVRVYPTYAMVDQSGAVTDRWAGYEGVERFIVQVEAALADRSTIAEKKLRFEADPTLPLALSLAQYSESVFANVEAVDYYRTVMALDPSRARQMRRKVFTAMFYGLRTEHFTLVHLVAEGRDLLADHGEDLEMVMLVENVLKRAAPPADYLPFLKHALAASAAALTLAEARDDPDVDREMIVEYRRRLAVDEALLIERDRGRALEFRRALLPSNWREDATEIHRFVWWCLENDLNLVDAHARALDAADLSFDDANRANILNTAAMLAYKLGDLDEAVALQARVVELSPARERYRDALARYEAVRDQDIGELIEPRSKNTYPDRVTIGTGGRSSVLSITGAGARLRTIMKVEVYTIASYLSAGLDLALYTNAPGGPAEAIRVLDVPKRLVMDLRRGLSRRQLVDTFVEVIDRNHADTSAFDDDLAAFLAGFDRDAQKGDRIVFDYIPGEGLTTAVNGEAKSAIAGTALMEALWTVWFGEKPVDDTLKRSLVPGA